MSNKLNINGKRITIYKICKLIRNFFDLIRCQKNINILIDCPKDFHYYHLKPLINELSKNHRFKITVLKWEYFCEKHHANIRYIDKNILIGEKLKTYDWYFTTEFGRVPWWFKGTVRFFFLHGIGPKVTYFATDKLKSFDVVLSTGPYIRDKQEPFVSNSGQLISAGLPALDKFYCNSQWTLPESCQFDNNLPVLLYAPSWSNDSNQISMDVELIRALTEQKICNVILRPHPNLFDPARCGGYDWEKTISELSYGKENMVVYSGGGTNIYDIIGSIDLLMSDISSVLYEFLIFNRPILIYLKESAGEYYDCDEYLSFTKESCYLVYKADELSSVLSKCLEEPKALSSKRTDLLKMSLFNYGSATVKMYRYFEHLRTQKS